MEQGNLKAAITEFKEKYDSPQVKVGQVVQTLGRQVTIPYWHQIFRPAQGDIPAGNTKVGSNPCIKIGGADEDAHIMTDSKQSGLVCFMPKGCFGSAILSVRITKVHKNSVSAEPVEWIEVKREPFLTQDDIGEECDYIFNKLDGAGVWHNRRIA